VDGIGRRVTNGTRCLTFPYHLPREHKFNQNQTVPI
jgi:hypothetical protein